MSRTGKKQRTCLGYGRAFMLLSDPFTPFSDPFTPFSDPSMPFSDPFTPFRRLASFSTEIFRNV
eukprot:4403551-Heterocapsa_arctica.AAC.1